MKNLVCKNAVALAYYGSSWLLVMGSWLYNFRGLANYELISVWDATQLRLQGEKKRKKQAELAHHYRPALLAFFRPNSQKEAYSQFYSSSYEPGQLGWIARKLGFFILIFSDLFHCIKAHFHNIDYPIFVKGLWFLFKIAEIQSTFTKAIFLFSNQAKNTEFSKSM